MISIIISTHGASEDVPIMLGILDRQREFYTGTPIHAPRTGPVNYLAGDYLEPFDPDNRFIETIVVCHGPGRNPHDYRIGKFLNIPRLKNSYGHHCREIGISEAKGKWITITSADNLYTAGWLHFVLGAIKDPTIGMVHWSTVNNYWTFGCGKNYKKHRIERGWVDLCSCLVRADIAKKVGFPWRNFDADADYLLACEREVRRLKLRIEFLPEILSVHQ